MLRFALCADDYAITPGVSRGILELLAASRLTAVSVMTTERGWPSTANELRAFASAADIGLHLNLTLGSPLGAMPGFAPGGRFPGLASVVRSALLQRLPVPELVAEIRRQLDAFADHFGRLPAYVDGHQHVHALPGLRGALLQTLIEKGLAGRVWLRDPSDRVQAILSRTARRKALIVAALATGFRGQALASGFDVNQGFAGFSDFDPAGDYAASFAASLRLAGPKHLVMCHPGYADDLLTRVDAVTTSRETELAFFRSPLFPEILARASADLVRLSEVL